MQVYELSDQIEEEFGDVTAADVCPSCGTVLVRDDDGDPDCTDAMGCAGWSDNSHEWQQYESEDTDLEELNFDT